MNEVAVVNESEVLGRSVKVYGSVEEPLFLAKDVAEWIEYDPNDINKFMNMVDEEEKLTRTIFRSGQNRQMWFLTEDGLYEVLMQSRKPQAKIFKKEVKKILKSIRKHGAYMTPEVARQVIDSPYFLPELAKAFIAEKEKTKQLEEKITEDKPYTELGRAIAISDQEIPIGELAKIICQNGYEIGRTRLFQYLRENEYLISRGDEKNLPRQHALEAGLFKVKACKFYDRGIEKVSLKSMVTPKGQLFFVNHFLDEKKES